MWTVWRRVKVVCLERDSEGMEGRWRVGGVH